jgi:hypothetical protein
MLHLRSPTPFLIPLTDRRRFHLGVVEGFLPRETAPADFAATVSERATDRELRARYVRVPEDFDLLRRVSLDPSRLAEEFFGFALRAAGVHGTSSSP